MANWTNEDSLWQNSVSIVVAGSPKSQLCHLLADSTGSEEWWQGALSLWISLLC